jgi:hypothetical protein
MTTIVFFSVLFLAAAAWLLYRPLARLADVLQMPAPRDTLGLIRVCQFHRVRRTSHGHRRRRMRARRGGKEIRRRVLRVVV